MRILFALLCAAFLSVTGVSAVMAQNGSPLQPMVTLQSSIAGQPYSSSNTASFTKTPTGLQVVLTPAPLSGSGLLGGHQEGLVLEIPDGFIRMVFF